MVLLLFIGLTVTKFEKKDFTMYLVQVRRSFIAVKEGIMMGFCENRT